MAKVVFRTTPKAAYEWAELDGGDSMSPAARQAFLDEQIEEMGLVPVETDFVGETPIHRYGRYKAGGAPANALAPTATAGRQEDLTKANAEIDELKAELARALDQLGKQPKSKQASIVNVAEGTDMIGMTAGGQTTEEARANLNTQDGVDLVGASEEVREDMSTADRSDDNPKRGPGRPKKA